MRKTKLDGVAGSDAEEKLCPRSSAAKFQLVLVYARMGRAHVNSSRDKKPKIKASAAESFSSAGRKNVSLSLSLCILYLHQVWAIRAQINIIN
jgi:hypothetical protein